MAVQRAATAAADPPPVTAEHGSAARMPHPAATNSADLVVEVVSPHDTMTVCRPGGEMHTVTAAETLTSPALLGDFTLLVGELFA